MSDDLKWLAIFVALLLYTVMDVAHAITRVAKAIESVADEMRKDRQGETWH